jgi:hypothetical protein
MRVSISKYIIIVVFFGSATSKLNKDPNDYGVDISSPIHNDLKDKSSIFSERYEKSMAGCYAKYSKNECQATERARKVMNLEQPRSQHNYTGRRECLFLH